MLCVFLNVWVFGVLVVPSSVTRRQFSSSRIMWRLLVALETSSLLLGERFITHTHTHTHTHTTYTVHTRTHARTHTHTHTHTTLHNTLSNLCAKQEEAFGAYSEVTKRVPVARYISYNS